ncbi:MAG: DNA alkylation repair protein [Candidatus Hinthialibacter antarcticus]|nr:DNA alkylation repair protein [Candidatus Hinthialibacter antarcticus]
MMASDKRLKSIIADIQKFLKANANPDQAKKYERYFTEGYDAYGIEKEIFIEKAERLVTDLKATGSRDDIYPLADKLLSSGKYEEASFAVHYAMGFKDQFKAPDFQRLGAWLDSGIINWGHTDVLCGEVLEHFLTQQIVSFEEMSAWRQSPSKWKRRAVPVSMIGLVKTKPLKKHLEFIEPLMMDDERFVQQGLGWFLREYWKVSPKPVEALLLKYKNSAPRKIYQYATEKMSKEQKELYRKARKSKS